MKISSKRYYGSTCHIVEFLPSEIRLEDTPGIPGKREHIRKIFGDPHVDEVTWLRFNRAFFDTNNPKSEAMDGSMIFFNVCTRTGAYFEPDPKVMWNNGTYICSCGMANIVTTKAIFLGIISKNPRTFSSKTDGTMFYSLRSHVNEAV